MTPVVPRESEDGGVAVLALVVRLDGRRAHRPRPPDQRVDAVVRSLWLPVVVPSLQTGQTGEAASPISPNGPVLLLSSSDVSSYAGAAASALSLSPPA
ncbi:MAG: hypothetical protein ACR2HP_03085 [Ilumatobacteraceae bacterium]